MFISSRHLNKKRLAPDVARSVEKRWFKRALLGGRGIGGVGGEASGVLHESHTRVQGRQTDDRPHGSQGMSELDRNDCLLSTEAGGFCAFSGPMQSNCFWFLPAQTADMRSDSRCEREADRTKSPNVPESSDVRTPLTCVQNDHLGKTLSF
ncbi:hypothetical protein [Caballeronia concitans]|uniref:hypothetical protein n=1 Tax=Caballeronia concitans TaxID=1777133 RepID=UPI00117ED621|nr:hypothetical protein [Caballeronia concitans]